MSQNIIFGPETYSFPVEYHRMLQTNPRHFSKAKFLGNVCISSNLLTMPCFNKQMWISRKRVDSTLKVKQVFPSRLYLGFSHHNAGTCHISEIFLSLPVKHSSNK